jgi:hypothetical protein
LWWLTLAPAALLGILGLAARALEGTLVKQATKRAAHDEIAGAVENDAALWRYDFDNVAAAVAPASKPPRPRHLRFASVFVFAPALLLIVPVLAVASVTVLGPAMAAVVVPNFGSLDGRLRSVELVREYAVPSDPDITATEAGRALVNLRPPHSASSRRCCNHPRAG